jgi:uncharacterized protein (TIGR03086 family)
VVTVPALDRLHLLACARFTVAVKAAEGKWESPSPCEGWDARGVVEHVIGFHDVLLLRPLGAKPERPRGDPQRRWELTVDALTTLLARPGLLDGPIQLPDDGTGPAKTLKVKPLLGALSQDVLVHSWDLARAVSADDRLDPELCAHFVGRLPEDPDALSASGMFASPTSPLNGADPQAVLLSRLGRTPSWTSS